MTDVAKSQSEKRAEEAEAAGASEALVEIVAEDPTAVYDPVDDYPERPLEEALSEPRKVELIAAGLAEGSIVEFKTSQDLPDDATDQRKAELIVARQASGRVGATGFKVTAPTGVV